MVIVNFVSKCLGIGLLFMFFAASYSLVDYVHRATPPDKISCEASANSSAGARIKFSGERLPERERPSAMPVEDGQDK